MGRRLNVVIVSSELPYPANVGNRIRTLNLALRLAPRHHITFISHRNGETEEAVGFLRKHDIDTVLVRRHVRRRAGPLFYARLVANIASPRPYSVVSHSSQSLRHAVRQFAERNRTDIWQLESSILLETADDIRGSSRKVVVAHNVESLIWQRYYENAVSPLRRWYIKEQWRKFERFERSAFAAATRVVAVSEPDATLIRARFGCPSVDVVDNGIDPSFFRSARGERDPKQILFLGSFDWRPNLEAVDFLLDEIFPAVLRAEPSAKLWLVGRRPPDALVRRVERLSQVELHADVPDVRPYLARSNVMVVPLRVGGGSRLKILEAMAAGLPVVSTCVGAEGLEVTAGVNYIAADGADEIARSLVECIRDPRPARAMAESSQRFVVDRYDWDSLAVRLEQVWFDCLEAPAPKLVGAGSS